MKDAFQKQLRTKQQYRDFYPQGSVFKDAEEESLVEIKHPLYPIEILAAAQASMGTDKMSDYFIDMYAFGIKCQQQGIAVKKKQLTGITLTHSKLKKWLAAQAITDIANLDDPIVTRIYLKHHIAAMESALAVFKTIAASVEGA